MGLDFETVRKGHESRDVDLLLGLYTDDAVIQIVDNTHPPTSPLVVSGKREIAEFLADVCGRNLTDEVLNEVGDDRRAAFTVSCRYPDGTRVLANEIVDLKDGKITREVIVQAWDS